ncbi:nuclear transport factor 2 family protein [Peribacillus sp. NPDC097198]|uniref:nuclear transport factor 2 family protein n=1 Tax=Peribacillus sp. NPDC097198 TaxID=3364397 RepID=UPI00382781EB
MSTLSYDQVEQLIQLFSDLYIRKEYATFLDLFAADIVFEFPYAQEPNPKRLDGKAVLQQYLEELEDVLKITSFTTPVIHIAADAPVFFAQFKASGKILVTGGSYEQSYISVVEVQNGRIIRYQDYWNPLAVTLNMT